MKRWITFDLDGTLLQNPFDGAVFPEISSRIKALGFSADEVMAAIYAEHESRMAANRAVDAYDWDEIVNGCMRSKQIPLSFDITALVIKYAHRPHISLLEEQIPAVLEQLVSRGFSLAVVTNGFHKYQYPVMEALGISTYFERVITPEQVGCAKPDTRIWDAIFREGELVAHVGDRIDHDVCAANGLGAVSVMIARTIPETLKRLRPEQRPFDRSFQEYCREKWKSETGMAPPADFTSRCLPDMVIGSIAELPDLEMVW